MLKKLVIGGALSLGVLGFGTAGQALAGTDIDIGIGVGGGGYYQPGPSYGYGRGRISCRQGARIAASAGFRRIRPVDCSGSEYVYHGLRRGDLFRIQIRSRSGQIKDVDRIRRGGGWGGGYDDDYDDY
ncbi:MAG: hypothetical protein ACOZAM_16250 [Pseudomonadota bacterium]